MKNKNTLAFLSLLFLLLVGLALLKARSHQTSSPEQTQTSPSTSPLAVNTIPVEQRPFVTLTPDSSGHNLTLYLDRPQTQGIIDYELVYTAGDKQEGAFGHLDLARETPPITKKILLGSKSAGGSITYHQDITGGYLSLTYDEIKLKEDFNFLRFDAKNLDGYSSVDARFTAYFSAKQLPQNAVVLIMKSFGLPRPLPQGKVITGPYYVGTAKKIAPQKIEIRVSASQPVLYEYVKGEWVKLETDYQNRTLTATPSSNLFVVVE